MPNGQIRLNLNVAMNQVWCPRNCGRAARNSPTGHPALRPYCGYSEDTGHHLILSVPVQGAGSHARPPQFGDIIHRSGADDSSMVSPQLLRNPPTRGNSGHHSPFRC